MPVLDDNKNSYRERVSLCTTTYDLLRLIREVTTEFGYRYFSIARLPSSKDERLASLTVLTNWPEELLRRYDEMGLLKDSPIYGALRTTTRPLIWSNRAGSRHLLRGHGREVQDMFCSFGMVEGVHISVQEPGGKRGAVGLSGDRPPPGEAELAELSYVANLIYERFSELDKGNKPQKTQKLSQREGECLMWTASGKTSAEIAIILKLSEHTVNHYLTAACQKLGATNRAHAVYKAMRAGYLD